MRFVRTLDGQTFGELVLHEPFMKELPHIVCVQSARVETFSIST